MSEALQPPSSCVQISPEAHLHPDSVPVRLRTPSGTDLFYVLLVYRVDGGFHRLSVEVGGMRLGGGDKNMTSP
jgi:hypothetical protein